MRGQVSGLHRHVRAGADCDAHVGTRQRRRVVDSVPDHADDPAFLLQTLDLGGLVAWQHLREHAIHAQFAGDGFGGAAIVARDHGDFQPHPAQPLDRRS